MTSQDKAGFQLSPQQKRLWLLWQAGEGGPFAAQSALEIEGNLDVQLLKNSIQRVVNRHEILRTTFLRQPGIKIPFQVINDTSEPLWKEVDISELEAHQQGPRIEELFSTEANSAFEFENDSPLRLVLITLPAGRHLLIATLPALCADSLTMTNLVRELTEFYGNNSALPKDQIQYADFSQWQNELLEAEDEEAEAGRAFWLKQNDSFVPLSRLLFEGEHDEQPQQRVASVCVELNESLATFSNGPQDFLFACWQTLLSKLTGQTDFGVNIYCDGRDYAELNGAFGLYAKSLPVLCSIRADVRFNEVLEEADGSVAAVYELHAYFNPEQSPEQAIGFEFYERPPKQHLNGLTFTVVRQYTCIDRFRVKLCCVRSESSLTAELRYDATLFQRETVEQIARHFQTLVASAVKNPETQVRELAVLNEAEQRQLLFDLNQTKSPYPADQCIHQLFEKQVDQNPSAPAVVFEHQQLSYAELNARANRLAHLLIEHTSSSNATIGLCVQRSPDVIVGLLGILKAGCAYVPLNPDHPKARLSKQLSDIQARVVVSQQSVAHYLPDFDGEVVCLDHEALFESQPATNPKTNATPASLAYVLYTSGSTGVPKGVAVQHRNLVNYSHFICEKLKLNTNEKLHFATVSTINADLGNTCIFPSLISGGCLHILSYDVATDGARFASYLTEHPIDVLKIVPAHLSSLLDTMGTEARLPRRYLILGGDVLSWELAERISRIGKHCEVINHYGPTETTVGSLTFDLREKGSVARKTTQVPIGRPISNTRIYILDRDLKLAPIGVAGQLCIAGAGVAKGYLNNPEETSKRFIANPYANDGMARLYLTGDLARYLHDGNVQFLGRLDHQVKIRGYRVELGEIETQLSQHPEVRQAVVVSRGTYDKSLVAYVVIRRGKSLTSSDLRTYLLEYLPDYMIPPAFVFLSVLPLTSNGKIDRAALPPAELAMPAAERVYVAPRTPVEELLAGIWTKLLKLEIVSTADNFFELGGHSLLATQVISRIRETFHVELPLTSLFGAPTVASLAQKIEAAQRLAPEVQASPILPVSRKNNLPLSFAQQRLWLLDQLEPGNYNYNVSRAIRLHGVLNDEALGRTLNYLLARHESLRTTFPVVDENPVQMIAESGLLSFALIDLSDLTEEQRVEQAEKLTLAEAQQPFDLAHGPLMRATLLRLADDHHVLLLTNHHIISDGWSGGIFFEEFAALYRAFLMGESSPLQELSLQYADYAVWQRESLNEEVMERELNYWKQQLKDAPPLLELPLDRPRPAIQTHRGERKQLIVPVSLAKALKSLSQHQGATMFMTLLAAFQLLLSRYSGQDDVSVGVPTAGRTHAAIERLIGCFLNTLVLRTKLSGDPTFCELLARVREVALGAFAHQGVPFERLMEELQPERNLSHQPLFQVFFNMQNSNMLNFSGNRVELPGLDVEHLPSADIGAKFDLTLYVVEGAEEMKLDLLYNADLFKPERMAEMLEQFRHLLEQIVEDPEKRINQFSLITQRAKELLPDPTQVLQVSPAESFHRLFSRSARQTPEHPAVVDHYGSLSYRELDERSNQLANYLRAECIRSQDIVAIYANRSASLVWALLGVLKAGAAFLILDPAYPVSRLIRYLKIARPQGWLEITQDEVVPPELVEVVNGFGCRARLALPASTRGNDPLQNYSKADPDVTVSPNDLAYVAFTSGSTGIPKGILGRHETLTHFGNWVSERFNPGPSDRFSMLSGLSHDPLHRDIFTALQLGATIVVPNSADLESPRNLAAWMNEQKISVANLTPAMAQLLTASDGFEIQTLRYAFLVGDVLTRRDVGKLRKLAACVTCVNLYGATETHFSLSHFVVPTVSDDESVPIEKQVLPLGKGIKEVQLLLLNSANGISGIGEVGEICFRSPHLTLGYLGDDALTRERFVINPFTNASGDRLYRTGDLGRYLMDGNVEFLGRLDRQVKIRGFRIELGEIEAVLVDHPDLRAAAVKLHEKDSTERFLAAYVVPVQNAAVSSAELRRHLRQKLPDYMIPTAFVAMDSLPLMPNGKVDHAALPPPDISGSTLKRTFVPPQTPAEEMIAAIWMELLRLEEVSVHDNFFDLGGHSLLATQVMSRVRDRLHSELPMRQLFESPTVAGLALAVVQQQANTTERNNLKDLLAELDALSDEETQRLLNIEMQ